MRRGVIVALALAACASVAAVTLTSRAPNASAGPSWTTIGELARPRAFARAVPLATGEILVVGGLDPDDPLVTVSSTELVDPATGRATVLPQRIVGRLHASVTVAWGDRVVVAGGTEWHGDGWVPLSVVDVFIPGSRTWLRGAPLRTPRSDHAAAALPDGRVLVAGGNQGTTVLGTTEIYDPRDGTWSLGPSLPRARTQLTLSALPDGRLLAAGGFEKDGKATRTTFLYDPYEHVWSSGPEMVSERLGHAVAKLPSGDLLFVSGESFAAASAEQYEWRARRFVHAGAVVDPRVVAQAAVLPDGRVVLAGGLPMPFRRGFHPLIDAEVWDPLTRTWSALPDAPSGRAFGVLVATDRGVVRLSGSGDDERAFRTIERFSYP